MHISLSNNLGYYNLDEYEKESFAPLAEEAEKLNQKITTLFKASANIDAHTAEVANKGNYDLLLIGIGQSIFEGSLLGKILGFTTRIINPERLLETVSGRESLFENSPFEEHTRLILAKTNFPVGIFIDKGLEDINNVFIPDASGREPFVMDFVNRLISDAGTQVTIAGKATQLKKQYAVAHTAPDLQDESFNHKNNGSTDTNFLKQQDLMIVSADNWKKLVESKSS